MVKVLKTSSLELAANFEEIFDGATVEEATKNFGARYGFYQQEINED